jgi:probable phosphoglycerate mutase
MNADAVTRVVLIRHGESASNAGGWLSGQETCGGLTSTGVAQAEALRWRLGADDDLRPDVVLVSTMRRAVETAEIIATPTGLVPEQRAELIERTSGEAEGLTVQEYAERYGKTPWSDWPEPISPGGESGHDFSTRVLSATDNVVADHRGKTVWVVCHGGVIMVSAMQRWPGGPTDAAALPAVSPANTSINEWLVDARDSWCLSRYNDHTHLVALPGNRPGDAPPPL